MLSNVRLTPACCCCLCLLSHCCQAGKLNLSRAEYTEEQIKDMMEYLSRGKAAASAPYRNVDFRKGRWG
jgi:hypothetical protein